MIALAKVLHNPHAEATAGVDLQVPTIMAYLERHHQTLRGTEVVDIGSWQGMASHPDVAERLIAERAIPAPPWPYTDDTQMARSNMSILRRAGAIDQDQLARSFALNYAPSRGYGPAMHGLLARLRQGEP